MNHKPNLANFLTGKNIIVKPSVSDYVPPWRASQPSLGSFKFLHKNQKQVNPSLPIEKQFSREELEHISMCIHHSNLTKPDIATMDMDRQIAMAATHEDTQELIKKAKKVN